MNPSTSPWDNVESVETDMIKFETVGKTVIGVGLFAFAYERQGLCASSLVATQSNPQRKT